MKSINSYLKHGIGALVLVAVLSSGCGKKEEPVTTVPAESAPVEAVAAPAARTPTPVAPTADASASIAAAQVAMQAQDYERAAAALLSAQTQRQPLTTEQAHAVHNQMIQLQQSLAAGVASGDPKAKAAAALLRQSTMR
jgi:hypothetical protein